MSSHFALTNIHQRFQQGARVLHVLQGASLEIGQGEVVALVGPSGSGKSSLLHIAGLMERPEQGSITLKGQVVTDADDKRRTVLRRAHVGFVYQFHNLLPEFTALENVAMPARLAGHTKSQALATATALIEKLGLVERASHLPSQLSGGEQQRAALARAMAAKPKLVLMDEPFSNLDPQLRDQMRDLTLRLLRENNAAGLIVTHDAADALRMADRIAVQNKGRILQVDTPEAIYQNPVDLHVAVMFGPLNMMADAINGGHIGVRPSDMALAGTAKDFSLEGDVHAVRAIGPDWLCDMELGDGAHWQALVRGGERPDTGPNKFFVPRARLMLFKAQ